MRHARIMHGVVTSAFDVHEVYQHNKEFVNPYPLTLQKVLANPQLYSVSSTAPQANL